MSTQLVISPEQALKNIDTVCQQAQGDRQMHMVLLASIEVLRQVIEAHATANAGPTANDTGDGDVKETEEGENKSIDLLKKHEFVRSDVNHLCGQCGNPPSSYWHI